MIKLSSFLENLIYILTIILFSSFYIFDGYSTVSIILATVTAIIFIFHSIICNMKLRFHIGIFHYVIALFGAYCFLSSIWAFEADAAITKGITILELLVCISIIYMHYYNDETNERIISVVMWSGFIVTGYAYYCYGVSFIFNALTKGIRLENSFANVNTFGMATAMACIILVYRLLITDYDKWYLIIVMVPCIALIAASGSRKAILEVIAGIVLVFVIKYSNENIIKTVLMVFLIGLVAYLVIKNLMTMPMFAQINRRLEGMLNGIVGAGTVDSSTFLRMRFKQLGLEQFYKTPVFGCGIANSGIILVNNGYPATYLHDNFVELLACGGITGFCIYYEIYFWALKGIWQRRNKTNDKYWKLCILLMVLTLIMDYGRVSYYSKSTYFIFAVFYLQIEKMKRGIESGV